MKNIIILITIIFILSTWGCERGEIVSDQFSYGDIASIKPEQKEKLNNDKIFFGHQSVGNNIINGLKDILKQNPEIRLSIVKSDNPEKLVPGTLEHFEIGKNEDPESKINAFSKIIRSGIGAKADIAFFKFCFVDITASTDVDALFKKYQNEMAELKRDYPNVKFVHITVPLLKQPEKSIKSMLKKLIGKGGDGFFDNSHNIARNRYNDLMKAAYEGKEPVFDLARLESIAPDGTVSYFNESGKRIITLCPEYTQDGGHLNDAGEKAIAEQFLVFLSELK